MSEIGCNRNVTKYRAGATKTNANTKIKSNKNETSKNGVKKTTGTSKAVAKLGNDITKLKQKSDIEPKAKAAPKKGRKFIESNINENEIDDLVDKLLVKGKKLTKEEKKKKKDLEDYLVKQLEKDDETGYWEDESDISDEYNTCSEEDSDSNSDTGTISGTDSESDHNNDDDDDDDDDDDNDDDDDDDDDSNYNPNKQGSLKSKLQVKDIKPIKKLKAKKSKNNPKTKISAGAEKKVNTKIKKEMAKNKSYDVSGAVCVRRSN